MTSPSLNKELVATLREAGAIVHSDGNIFFTNAEKFLAAARASTPSALEGAAQVEARAYVDGNEHMRELRWMPDKPSFDLPVGTKLYASPLRGLDAARWQFFSEHAQSMVDGIRFGEWLQFDGVMKHGSREAAIDFVMKARDAAIQSQGAKP